MNKELEEWTFGTCLKDGRWLVVSGGVMGSDAGRGSSIWVASGCEWSRRPC